ncbi:MAG: chromate transporter, partial [Clostridiales bacterium]
MIWQLFHIFFKIGAITIGGGYAILPMIQQELVGAGLMTM